jgi:LPS export ABC transporter protein LptC
MTFPGNIAKGMLLTGAILLGSVLVFGIWKGSRRSQEVEPVVAEPAQSQMTLAGIEFTEIEQGRKSWTLRASEARYFQEEQKTQLKEVQLVFYLNDGQELLLTSREGLLYAGTKDMELRGGIEATVPLGYQLSSENAFYGHQQQRIHSDAAIQVKGPALELEGSRWEYSLATQRAVIQGGVKATLSPNRLPASAAK